MLKLLLLLFIALVIVAVRFLPWWSLLILAVLAIAAFNFFVRWVFLAPFKMKGVVLHGATLQVHSVQRTLRPPSRPAAEYEHEPAAAQEPGEGAPEVERPSDAGGSPDGGRPGGDKSGDAKPSGDDNPRDDEPHSEAREFYFADVTLTPLDFPENLTALWEPDEIMLSMPGKNPMSDSDSGDVGEIEQIEFFMDGAFAPAEKYKYEGTQRMRLLLAVDPTVHKVQLNYYFEPLGTIELKRSV